MRQHLIDVKSYLKEDRKHLANDEKRLEEMRAEQETTTDKNRKRELKIKIKVLETDNANFKQFIQEQAEEVEELEA